MLQNVRLDFRSYFCYIVNYFMKHTPSITKQFLKSKPRGGDFFPADLDGSVLPLSRGPHFFRSLKTITDLFDRGSRAGTR